ncbi:MAG TPA: hypothetical protein VNJ54_06075 [Plantibacter sp.]|uniref:hypothetical protein n=1 Tax=Plantibacter sp. TaxID=1871045 RepID=UPI002C13D71F|nr:hypothetical protein [Plantibacter sp.]
MPKGMLDSFALQQQSMQFVVADLSAGTGMGVSLAALGAIVFGALSASTEYRRGSMAFSSLAEPRRLTLIATKVAAVTIAAALTAVPLALCKGLALALGLTSQGISSLIDPVELVSLWGRGAIALILLALLGFGIGLITRSQVACFAIAFGGLLAESTARTLGALISGGQTSAASFLPFGLVADAVRGTSFGGLNLASIGMAAGLLTLAAWAIALLSGGVVRFIRSDVPTSG